MRCTVATLPNGRCSDQLPAADHLADQQVAEILRQRHHEADQLAMEIAIDHRAGRRRRGAVAVNASPGRGPSRAHNRGKTSAKRLTDSPRCPARRATVDPDSGNARQLRAPPGSSASRATCAAAPTRSPISAGAVSETVRKTGADTIRARNAATIGTASCRARPPNVCAQARRRDPERQTVRLAPDRAHDRGSAAWYPGCFRHLRESVRFVPVRRAN
jgi:hypothetical protein